MSVLRKGTDTARKEKVCRFWERGGGGGGKRTNSTAALNISTNRATTRLPRGSRVTT